MSYSLWNLCNRSDSETLSDALRRAGFVIRNVDTSEVDSGAALRARFGENLGFSAGGWDSFADEMWNKLFSDDDEEDKIALVWDNADHVAERALGALLQTVDILTDVGRQAYADQIQVITFLMGDGPSFDAVDINDMFPGLD